MGMNPAMARAIAQADQMGGGNWPKDGRYLWCVERLWLKTGGFKGDSFIANFYVVEAAATSQVQPNAPGSTACPTPRWVCTAHASGAVPNKSPD